MMTNFQTKQIGAASVTVFLLGLAILLSGEVSVSQTPQSAESTDSIVAELDDSISMTGVQSAAGVQLAAFEEPIPNQLSKFEGLSTEDL